MRGFRKSKLWTLDIPDDVKAPWPLIIDDNSLAFRIGITNKTLQWMLALRQAETAYKHHAIPEFYDEAKTKFKKVRNIQEPVPRLKEIHTSLNGLFSSIPLDPCVTAYRKGQALQDDILQHVRPYHWFPDDETEREEKIARFDLQEDARFTPIVRHEKPHDPTSPLGKAYVMPIWAIQIDISNFFNSIKASWIRKFFFYEVGYTHRVSQTIARLCTVKQGDKRYLAQGSPLSGSLANLVAYHRFGRRLKEYLATQSNGWVYTIYSDDLFLSHPANTLSKEEVYRVRNDVIKIIERAGFAINHKKVKVKNSKSECVTRLGAVICEGVNIPRHKYQSLKSLIYNASKHGFDAQAERMKVASGANVVNYIRGMLQYFRQMRPDRYAELDKLFKEALEKHPPELSKTIKFSSGVGGASSAACASQGPESSLSGIDAG